MRRLAVALAALLLVLLAVPIANAQEPAPRLRALLVGADRFEGHPNTEPAARDNLYRLAAALRRDSRGYASIRISLNERHSADSFRHLVHSSFHGAGPKDTSLFYITTHGLYEHSWAPMRFAMVLSDGQTDYALTAAELFEALEGVPGLKILIIDTCNAGALIDRGMPGDGLRSLFTGKDYRVLAASGGSEPSYFWSTGQGSYRGGSYFADSLLQGISATGRFAADSNRDGTVTLGEVYAFLLSNYGVSTPQVYPRDDQTAVLQYEPGQPGPAPAVISHLVLSDSAFSADMPMLDFSYTLNRRARVAYQLIYQQEDSWRFAAPQVIADGGEPDGESRPGRKEKSLRVTLHGADTYGYALLFVTTVNEDSATPHAQALLMVEPAQGDPGLLAQAALPAFSPHMGQEMPIYVRHRFPLRPVVRVLDQQGNIVQELAQGRPTRPQHLPDGGSLYYWTGKDRQGTQAPSGQYVIEVSAFIGGEAYSTRTQPFSLMP
ncbi:MAG: hypothetical protein GX653_03165 [Clostridiales bacterium]|nr:hypothetical protein [Clostridiales bacterium]